MELVERKYSKYFKNLTRKIKRNGYKMENMSKAAPFQNLEKLTELEGKESKLRGQTRKDSEHSKYSNILKKRVHLGIISYMTRTGKTERKAE